MAKNLRYEIKMVFDALRLDEVRSWVLAHSDSFRVAYLPRQVNNIYFDTVNRNLMMDHLNGVANRSKIRFRWYGESWQGNGGQLEIKKKAGRLGYKITRSVGTDIDIRQMTWREIFNILIKEYPDEFSMLFGALSPTIINQYQREYYLSMDGVIRLTLDYHMRAYGQSFGFKPNINFPQPIKNDVIIEMKAPKNAYKRMANALAEFPLRSSQNSKYLNAIEFVI
jgi:hypothetical protein